MKVNVKISRFALLTRVSLAVRGGLPPVQLRRRRIPIAERECVGLCGQSRQGGMRCSCTVSSGLHGESGCVQLLRVMALAGAVSCCCCCCSSFSYFNCVVLHLSYTLGSSEKQIVSEDKELFTLESRVEIEKSIKQVILL